MPIDIEMLDDDDRERECSSLLFHADCGRPSAARHTPCGERREQKATDDSRNQKKGECFPAHARCQSVFSFLIRCAIIARSLLGVGTLENSDSYTYLYYYITLRQKTEMRDRGKRWYLYQINKTNTVNWNSIDNSNILSGKKLLYGTSICRTLHIHNPCLCISDTKQQIIAKKRMTSLIWHWYHQIGGFFLSSVSIFSHWEQGLSSMGQTLRYQSCPLAWVFSCGVFSSLVRLQPESRRSACYQSQGCLSGNVTC